jgi:hypothetical protein
MYKRRGAFNFPRMRGGVSDPSRGSSDQEVLYYTAQIVNTTNETSQKLEDPPIVFNDTRVTSLLDNIENYGISVENIVVNGAGKNLPVFIPQIRQFNSDGSINKNPNNTVYDVTFTIQYGGTKTDPVNIYQSTRSVQWVPQNLASWTVQPPDEFTYPQQEINYYYCYTYSHWVKLVNSALALAWADCISAAKNGGVSGTTIVVNSLNGYFTEGGLVENFTSSGTKGTVISFKNNSLVLYNTTGTFSVGDLIFQEPDVGTAYISSVTTGDVVVPAITLGTVCPFFTYDSKTNLFSLAQDANTCVTPFGSSVSEDTFSPSNPPNSLNVFGASNASGYMNKEYSFVGYNTNLESLFSNFNTYYYSNQIPYPSAGVNGVVIDSPQGTETVNQLSFVSADSARIAGFTGPNMNVSWIGNPGTTPGSNWVFNAPTLTSSTVRTGITGGTGPYNFTTNLNSANASYIQPNLQITCSNTGGTLLTGNVSSYSGTTLGMYVSSVTGPTGGSNWTFNNVPLTSTSFANPQIGVPISLQTNLYPLQTPIKNGTVVDGNGATGDFFRGIVTDFTTSINYVGPTGSISGNFLNYTGSNLANGFNPVVSFQAQNHNFSAGDTIQGETTNAVGKVIEIISGNSNQENTISVIKQSGPFSVNEMVNDGSASAIITKITGPNIAQSVVRTGIVTIDPIFPQTQNYAGPFVVGSNVINVNDPGVNGIITAITGDNGYTRVDYSQLKNPFTFGATVECFASLANLTEPNPDPYIIASGTITDISGDNNGFGTMNFTEQNGKFGVGETIVTQNSGGVAVGTIVAIQGDNNGYASINYINQLTTDAPGAFVPGEFLLLNGVAFAKVVLDTQNVINEVQGNIGTVLCITGEEIGEVFYATSNVPLPLAGALIQGSTSGTVADYGGVAYLENGTLTISNICGTFYTGDTIVDTVGFGIPGKRATTQTTAVCNGVSYLGTGSLTIKNAARGPSSPTGATPNFPASSFIVDFASAGTTNPLVVVVEDIPTNLEFYQGKTVNIIDGSSEVYGTATILANNGPIPYGNSDTSTQVLTLLPLSGGPLSATVENYTISDTTAGKFLNNIGYNSGAVQYSGAFNIGDIVTKAGATGTIFQINPPSSDFFPSSIALSGVIGTFTPGIVTNTIPVTRISGGTSFTVRGNSQTPIIPVAGQRVYNWTQPSLEPAICNFASIPVQVVVANGSAFSVGDLVTSAISGIQGNITAIGGNTLTITCYNQYRFVNGEILNDITKSPNTSSTISSNTQQTGFNINLKGNVNYAGTDIISVFPLSLYGGNDLLCLSATIVVNQNFPAIYVVGTTIYVYNYNPSGQGGINHIRDKYNGTGIITSTTNVAPYTMTITFSSFQDTFITSGQPYNVSAGIRPQAYISNSSNDYTTNQLTVASITNYGEGFVANGKTANFLPTIYTNSVTNSSPTSGIIATVNTSPSSAFVQTTIPPTIPTTLSITNVSGTFAENDSIGQVEPFLVIGKVNNYTNTTDYSGTLTVLSVKNVVGSFEVDEILTNNDNSVTANISGKFINNGSFIMQSLNGTFQPNEIITDLNSDASATYLSSANQTITATGATGTVLIDNGSQLSMTGVTGTFSFPTTITSNLGVTANAIGFPKFGVGSTVTNSVGESGIVVSDNGSVLVVDNLSQVSPYTLFAAGQTIRSGGVTGTIQSVSNPTLTVTPLDISGDGSSWTIVPATLTSSSTVKPPTEVQFMTNLDQNETIFKVGDTLAITQSDSVLSVEQIYYPENVVQVDLSAGNGVLQTLQSAFPSSVSGPTYVVLTQDIESTSSLWSPVASIVVGTQQLCIAAEYTANSVIVGTGNLGNNTTAGAFANVIIETPIEVLPQTGWRGLLSYNPQVDIFSVLNASNEPLKELDFQLYWRNRVTNNLTPLLLYNNGSATIRLMFKKIRD